MITDWTDGYEVASNPFKCQAILISRTPLFLSFLCFLFLASVFCSLSHYRTINPFSPLIGIRTNAMGLSPVFSILSVILGFRFFYSSFDSHSSSYHSLYCLLLFKNVMFPSEKVRLDHLSAQYQLFNLLK